MLFTGELLESLLIYLGRSFSPLDFVGILFAIVAFFKTYFALDFIFSTFLFKASF